jgi:hypothetical protein
MVERRKMSDRRVNPPRQGLTFYYRRYTADRRQFIQAAQRNARVGVVSTAQPDV